MYLSRRIKFRQKYNKQKLILYGILGLIALTVVGFIFSFILFAWYAKDLPSPGKLSQVSGFSTVFYDRDGKVIYDMYKDKNRVPVKFSEISDDLKKATIAIEDKNFYKHGGISEAGIIRGLLINPILKRRIEGGSTITQQLIKNVLLDSSRTFSRKIKEWILAISVEKKYTKDEILEMYLNEAPYGGSYWGIGSAARGYFDKEPKDLNLVESVILAGLPQSPTYYSPFIGEKDAWKGRATDVLRRMREDGYITKTQETTSLEKIKKFEFSTPYLSINAPHFVFYIKDQVEKEYGPKIIDQGIKIKTTLSLEVEKIVEKIVKEEIEKLKGFHATNSAVVVLDSQTSEILAMVGSYDFNNKEFGKFNAGLGLRQPGSALKPIEYALAFEKGYTPATVIMDVKTVFPDQGGKEYIPDNYDSKFRGPIQLRFALGNSINIPAVKLQAIVGLKDFLTKASVMGLATLSPSEENLKRFGLSISLGGGEVTLVDLTKAYSVFARGGRAKDEQAILEISDYKKNNLFKKKNVKETTVLSPEISFLISHILSDNNARVEIFGPNSYLNIPGKTVAVKTGTTNDKRDNWAVGYTKSITVGVWVGNNDNTAMDPKISSGATGASPIFYRIMNELLKKYPDGIMDKPEKVKAVTIDSYLGGLPKEGGQTRSEYFIEGTEPKDIAPFYKKLKISKSNGKLANDIEIKNGNYEEKDFIVFTENDPVSSDGKNRWQEAINEWLKTQGDSKYHPPTEISDASADSVVVSIKSPDNEKTLNSNDVSINARITSVESIKNIKIYLNGSEVRNFNEDKKEVSENMNLSDGVYELKIVATNSKDKSGESTIKFGINKPWDSASPTPTTTITSTP